MNLEIREEDPARLDEYARISIAFDVDRIYDLDSSDPHDGPPFSLRERRIAAPWRKDYDDALGSRPEDWPARFDFTNWGVLAAWRGNERVGGAVVAVNTEGVDMLEGRDDLAVLWDLRVEPEIRNHGVGSALFAAALRWTRKRGCVQLKVETQNINVPACQFYAGRGCQLASIRRDAYPDLPDEIQLLWVLDL